ncbi:MAG TPA: SDR family oxidoreductase [Saprospiraceae bacterium]|nr:SDR family oxidoreductase [Saprospiraceae bacterium]
MNMNAVVTGSTKGIGRAIVFALLKEGWNVAISSRNESDLNNMKSEIDTLFPSQQSLAHKVDFSKKDETIQYGTTILNQWKKIDLLVNNVGLFIPDSVHKEEDGALENMIAINLYSAYHLTRAILPVMIPMQKGLIINMCSIASFMSYPNGGSYTISKFAMLGFSKVLREEMKPYGIKVTSIMPGSTWTDSWKDADFPYDRLMQADDIAIAVIALTKMSPAAVVEEIIIRPQLGDLP